jgi:hypothetical protein
MKYLSTTASLSISIVASLFFTVSYRGQAQESTDSSTGGIQIANQTTNNPSTKVQPPASQNSNGVRTRIGDRYMNCAVTADRSGMTCTEESKQENSNWKVEVHYRGFYPPSFQSN